MRVPSSLSIAIRALRRNRLQTALTIAGMKLIVVTAGNYKVKTTDDFGGGAVEPSAALRERTPTAEIAEHAEKGFLGDFCGLCGLSTVARIFSIMEVPLFAHP